MSPMRRILPVWVFVGLALTWAGCGGCGDDAVTQPECRGNGVDCDTGDQCCTGACNDVVGVCVPGPECLPAGRDCQDGLGCCTFACVDYKCSDRQCTSDGEACGDDDECCGGACDDGRCTALNPACATTGNACSGHGDCCSHFCNDAGLCASPSYCRQTGDVCSTDFECCGGMCERADGATYGLCAVVPASGVGGCKIAGEVCGAGAGWDGEELPLCGGECCSRACQPYGSTGVLICQPPSGCRPTGEVCRDDDDCCGSAGLPDGDRSGVTCSKDPGLEFGRCTQGNACTPAGGICRLQSGSCNENANCCAGNVLQFDTCALDNLGIPRCRVAEIDCGDPSQYEGLECATAADCCGLPCLPNPGGDPPLICGGACVEENGECTTTADCCSGPCTFTPGEPTGFCGPDSACLEYGQQCDGTTPCCNDVPCTNGVCQIFVP
jgi:hypothetical protein